MAKTLRKALLSLALTVAGLYGVYVAASAWVTQQVIHDRFTPGEAEYQGAAWCQSCHPLHYQQWSESLHAEATTLDFRPLHLMQTEACYSCHGFEDSTEGVSCEICHGPGHTAKTDFGPTPLCARCHADVNPVTGVRVMLTPSEWRESQARDHGQDCYDCHMPLVEDSQPAMHFHGFRGNVRHPEIYPGKIRITELSLSDGTATLSVENTVTGHYMPTGCPSKFIELLLEGRDRSGALTYQEARRFQRRMDRFVSRVIEDNRLRDGESRELTFALPPDVATLEARLTLSPSGLWEGGRGQRIELDRREVRVPADSSPGSLRSQRSTSRASR